MESHVLARQPGQGRMSGACAFCNVLSLLGLPPMAMKAICARVLRCTPYIPHLRTFIRARLAKENINAGIR